MATPLPVNVKSYCIASPPKKGDWFQMWVFDKIDNVKKIFLPAKYEIFGGKFAYLLVEANHISDIDLIRVGEKSRVSLNTKLFIFHLLKGFINNGIIKKNKL